MRTDGTEVKVAYGTSRHLDHLRAGEFAIRKQDNPAAYALAGLSYDTKFNLAETLALPWTDEFFAVPAEPAHGQIPKLGTLHPGMMKIVAAAFRSARPSKLVKSRTR